MDYTNRAHLTVTLTQLARRKFPKEMISTVLDENTGELMEYRNLMKNPKYCPLYQNSYSKEIGRLAQGMPFLVEGTNTMFFIYKTAVPADRWRDVIYGRIVVDYRPEKTDPFRTRLTVGGDRVKYPVDYGAPTAKLTAAKLILNITVSTLNLKLMTIDIKDFYLNTPMDRSKCMHLKLRKLPESVVQHYNLA